VAAKALPHFGIDAFEGLEDGNWRELAFCRSLLKFPTSLAQEAGHSERGQKIKKQTANGSNHGNNFEHCSRC